MSTPTTVAAPAPADGVAPPPDAGPRDRTRTRPVRLVAGREIRASFQKRSFWVGAGLTLAIVLAIAVIPGLLDDGDDVTERSVGLTGPSVALEAPLVAVDEASDDLAFEVTTYDDASDATTAARDGDVDAAVVDGTILVQESAPDDLVAILDQAARSAQVAAGVEDGLVDADLAADLAAPQVLVLEALEPVDDDENARRAMVVLGMFLIFFQIFSFGYAVAGGIVEEKSSRVVEVLLSKVRPGQLLAGKLVGIWLVTTAQMLVYATVGLTAATLSGTLDLPPGWAGVVALVLAWYVVAYVFFACVFAICGALAASSEELQSTMTPATILVMVGYFLAIVAMADPNGTAAVIGSFVPATAPLVMPIRSVLGDTAAWEVVVSIGLTLAVGLALIPIAGRIYKGSVLTTRQTKVLAAWRSASD